MIAKYSHRRRSQPGTRAIRQASTAAELIIVGAVLTTSVALIAIGCPPFTAPTIAGSAGLAGVNAARHLNNRGAQR
ncbi:hypothetical protein GCM10009839_00220 [Catenulispora yoronensis]|uniref:Lipoprotein n=1 Tax=Catenulispora yoronensis TaxID=450799 RepID=A0ABP5F0F3_9ACTN